jgi:hypothetical protein
VSGDPNIVKADCKSGLFLPIGEKPTVRNANGKPEANPAGRDGISMQLLKFGHWPNALLFPVSEAERKTNNWVEALYVDERGMVCATLFKGESRDRFLRAVMTLEAEGEGLKNYTDYVLHCTMSPRTSAKFASDYYAVEFSAAPIAPEDFERNREFAAERFDEVFSARTALEFVAQNIPQVTGTRERAVAALEILFANGFISQNVLRSQNALLIGEAVQTQADEK